MDVKIYSVESAGFSIVEGMPAKLLVNAAGTVNSTGWTDGRLVPWMYTSKPADGMINFEFIAATPSGLAMLDMSRITGQGLVELDGWIKGIRVHASAGSLEFRLSDSAYEDKAPVELPGDAIAWKWNV
jgi:hypothetical protein